MSIVSPAEVRCEGAIAMADWARDVAGLGANYASSTEGARICKRAGAYAGHLIDMCGYCDNGVSVEPNDEQPPFCPLKERLPVERVKLEEKLGASPPPINDSHFCLPAAEGHQKLRRVNTSLQELLGSGGDPAEIRALGAQAVRLMDALKCVDCEYAFGGRFRRGATRPVVCERGVAIKRVIAGRIDQ